MSKIKEFIKDAGKSSGFFNKNKTSVPPTKEFIVKSAKAYKEHNEIAIDWEPVQGYGNGGKYYILDKYKDKIDDIVALLNNNAGKPLSDIFEMDLP